MYQIFKERRSTLGITQQDLADISGVGLRTIKQIETGKANPAMNTVQKIIGVLGMEMVFQLKKTDRL
ncbi:helix-turn-helix domain-containing protein [Viscerimonas tarda]